MANALEQIPSPMAKLLLTVEEAAELLSVSRTRLYGLLGRNVILSIKEGRARLVPVAELERYVEQRLAERSAGSLGNRSLRLVGSNGNRGTEGRNAASRTR